MYLLKSRIHAHGRISASGTLSLVKEHNDKRVKKQVPEKPTLKHGQEVYFMPENGTQRRRGKVVGGDTSGWHVQGRRQNNETKAAVHVLPRHHVWTEDEYNADKPESKGIRETIATGRWLIPATELNRRAQVAASRFNIDEREIMAHPAINEIAQNTLAKLAHSNGINSRYIIKNGTLHNDDLEGMELYSEYATAMMGSLRREVSQAPQADLDEFREYLDRKRTNSRISVSMTMAGRGAAIRYLKDREKKRRELVDFQDMENDPALRRDMETTLPEHETELTHTTVRNKLIDQFVGKLPAIEAEIIQRKYGLGDFLEPQSNEDIANALNSAGKLIPVKAGEMHPYTGQTHPSDSTIKWTRNHVTTAHLTAIENLKDIHGTNVLRGFLKGVLEVVTLRKSGKVRTSDEFHKKLKERLKDNEEHRPTIAVDFDGPIADYSKGFQGEDVFGEPVPGVSSALKKLKDEGWKIIIYTTRQETPALRSYLGKNDISYDEINKNSDQPENTNDGKPIADVCLDDRAIRFDDWTRAMSDIEAAMNPLIKSKSEFNTKPFIQRVFNDATHKAMDVFGIRFDLENYDPVNEIQTYSSGDHVFLYQLCKAGGDWENPSVLFRCQLKEGYIEGMSSYGKSGGCFVYIPGKDEGNYNLVPGKKDGTWVASDDETGKDLQNPDENKCVQSLKAYLDRLALGRAKPALAKSIFQLYSPLVRLSKSFPDAVCRDINGQLCVVVTSDDLRKSYSSDLAEQYPGGKWITVREGALAGRHIFILPQRDGSARIVAGGGPFLKDKVLTGQQDPKQVTVERSADHEAPTEPVTVQVAEHDKTHTIPPSPEGDTSLKHSDDNYRYRDIGHVPGSRKELAAEQAIMIKQRGKSGAGVNHREIDWEALEENPREAHDLITKEMIAKEVDWDGLKEKGVEPGAGFLLNKLYSAVAPKPEDSPEARKDFVFGLNALQERFEGVKTPEDVVNKIKEISEEMTGFTLTPEQQKEWQHLGAVKETVADIYRKLKREQDALTEVRQGPGGRLSGLQWEQQKRTRRGWKPDPELQQRIDDLKKEVDAAQSNIDNWHAENGEKLKMAENAWRTAYHQQEKFKKDVISKNIIEHPLTRGWNSFGKKFYNAINYRSYNGSDSFGAHVATAKSGKIGDWSWLDKDSKPRAASKQSVHFQLKVAEQAERVGGAPLPKRDFSTEDLKHEFNLANVQSGNWVLKDLNSAKHHTEQCAMAMQDMADILGIPHNEISMNGRLSIAFGARGSGGTFGPGAAAHYENKYRVINLTKMKGGGSLGHEWFHFLDDVVGEVETGERKGSATYATDQPGSTEVLKAFKDLSFEMENGGHNEMVKTKLTITESERDHWLKRVEQAKKSNFYGARTILGIVNAPDLSASIKELNDKWNSGAFGAIGGNKGKNQYNLYKQMAVAVHAGTEGTYDAIGYKPGSRFYVESQKIDAGTGGKSTYWQSRKEMAARAFAAYMSDKLHEKGRENTYLTSHADNKFYVMEGVKPYPEGEERTRINAAFDRAFAAIKEHGTLKKAMARMDVDILKKSVPNLYLMKSVSERTGAK